MYIEFYGRTPLISSVAAGVMMDVRAETVEFVLASRQGQLNLADYTTFVKSATPMYSWLDKKKVEAEDLGDGRIRIEWAIDRGNTNEKTLNVQLQFEAENAEVVWQTEIVKFNFSGTVDVDEEMPKQYPSIVQTFEATAADLKAEAEQLSGEFTDFKGEVETNLNEFRDELHSNATSFVFNTYEELQEALSTGSTPFDGSAKVGDSLWIKDVDVPDYWVSGVDPYEISEAEAGGLIKNISDGTGTGSLNQIQDGTGGTFDFTNKNPNATAIDPTLTGNIPYGAIGDFSTSLGGKSSAQGKRSTAKGTTTIAKGKHSSAEGDNSVSLGDDSHAEGNKTTSVGLYSHSEGLNTVSKGLASHAEGAHTLAGGAAAHAQGASTTANGDYSFAGGRACTATTEAAFAFGRNVLSRGNYSAVFGYNTKNDPSAAIGVLIAGAYNESKPDMVLEIGNGTSEGSRRNAFEVTRHGNARAYGTPSAYNDLTPKRYVDSITNSKVDRTTTINKKPLTSNITLTADDVGALKNTTKYGATLTLDIDPNTFILTARLKDQDGNILGKEQQIDLPLETMVVNATYDSSSKEIILTLQNGNTTRVPVGDLVDGLVTEEYVGEHYVELISSPNKFVYGGQGGNQITYGVTMSPEPAHLAQYNNNGHLKSNDPEEPLDVVNLDYAQNNYVDINSEQYIYGTKHFYDVINVQKGTDTTRNSVQVGIDNTGGFISLWGKNSGMAGVNSTHILIEDNEGNPPHKLAFPTSWVKPDTAFATETIATEEKLQYLFFSELPLSSEQKEILVNSGAINYLSDELHDLLSVVNNFYIQFPARLIEIIPITLYFHKDEELDYATNTDDRYVFSCRHSDSDVFMLVYNASPNGNRLLTFDRIKLPDYSTVQLSLNNDHINNLVTNGYTSGLEDEFHSILTSKDIFYIHFAPGTIGSSDRNFYFRKTEYFTTTDDTPVTHYIFKSIYNNDKIYTLNYIPSPDRYLEMSITSGSVDTNDFISKTITADQTIASKLRVNNALIANSAYFQEGIRGWQNEIVFEGASDGVRVGNVSDSLMLFASERPIFKIGSNYTNQAVAYLSDIQNAYLNITGANVKGNVDVEGHITTPDASVSNQITVNKVVDTPRIQTLSRITRRAAYIPEGDNASSDPLYWNPNSYYTVGELTKEDLSLTIDSDNTTDYKYQVLAIGIRQSGSGNESVGRIHEIAVSPNGRVFRRIGTETTYAVRQTGQGASWSAWSEVTGGSGGSSPSNMVTTDTTQLITGRKTFVENVYVSPWSNEREDYADYGILPLGAILDGEDAQLKLFEGGGSTVYSLDEIRVHDVTHPKMLVLQYPQKAGTYTLATTDDIVDASNYVTLNTDQTISGYKNFDRRVHIEFSNNDSQFMDWSNDSLLSGALEGTKDGESSIRLNHFSFDSYALYSTVYAESFIRFACSGYMYKGTLKFPNEVTDLPNFNADVEQTIATREWAEENFVDKYSSNFVTTDTTQTISGQKTFTSAVTVNTNSNTSVWFSAFDNVTNGGATLRSRPTFTAISVYGDNSTLKTYDTGVYANSFIQYVRDGAYLRLLFPDPDPTTSEIVTETIATQEYVAKAIANAITTTLNTAV